MNYRCAELRAAGKPYVIADAATPMDLAAVAELTVDWPLMTGNSSVAAYYPKLWRERALSLAVVKPDLPPIFGPGVVLAGSCADRTLKQLEIFAAHRPVRFIDLHDAKDQDVVQAAIDWALPLLVEGPVAIATSALPDAVRSVQSRWGQRAAAGMAEAILEHRTVRLNRLGFQRG